jgi:hypothetical protein
MTDAITTTTTTHHHHHHHPPSPPPPTLTITTHTIHPFRMDHPKLKLHTYQAMTSLPSSLQPLETSTLLFVSVNLMTPGSSSKWNYTVFGFL